MNKGTRKQGASICPEDQEAVYRVNQCALFQKLLMPSLAISCEQHDFFHPAKSKAQELRSRVTYEEAQIIKYITESIPGFSDSQEKKTGLLRWKRTVGPKASALAQEITDRANPEVCLSHSQVKNLVEVIKQLAMNSKSGKKNEETERLQLENIINQINDCRKSCRQCLSNNCEKRDDCCLQQGEKEPGQQYIEIARKFLALTSLAKFQDRLFSYAIEKEGATQGKKIDPEAVVALVPGKGFTCFMVGDLLVNLDDTPALQRELFLATVQYGRVRNSENGKDDRKKELQP